MKKLSIIIVMLFLFRGVLFSQVGINTDNSAPDPSAMLDVKSIDKGFLPPRMTTDQMNSIISPPDGLIVYNVTVQSLYWYNGSTWKQFNETTFMETDPIFTVHPASGITEGNISDWNSAFGWGDHALAGYLTSFTETDPIFTVHPASGITEGHISDWNSAFGWGDHALAGYLTSYTETDPVFTVHPASGITDGHISDWNSAYSWGDHALAGYVDLSTDQMITGIKTFSADVIASGNLMVNGTFSSPSDERLKTNIETLTGVLAKIDQLRGVQFVFIDQQKYATGSQIGVIAQELQKVFPQLVSRNGDGYLAVNYTQLNGVLIQAIKEQQKEIDELKNQMKKQQQQIDMIFEKIAK